MRELLLILLAALAVFALFLTQRQPQKTQTPTPSPQLTQEIWQGALEVASVKLRLVLKIAKAPDGKLTGTLDSIDQGAKDLPIDSITQQDNVLRFEMKNIDGRYEGTVSPDGSEVSGQWTQAGQTLPLTFKRLEESAQLPELKRPQEPKKPYPYREEEVVFDNKGAGIRLAGTLTLPRTKGPFPAAVLISGSGPQDRDETVAGHRPFLILADYLTRRGTAVLRFDDRGFGKSKGNFASATTEDFTTDARAAVEYLKTRREIDIERIGLLGHSEGGLIAPIVAAQSPDDIAFVVLLAGPSVTGEEILYLQQMLIAKASGASDEAIAKNRALWEKSFSVVKSESDNAVAEQRLRELLKETLAQMSEEEQKALGLTEQMLELQTKQILSPWFRFFLTYDPRPALRQLRAPVLALYGERDLQVPPQQNVAPMAAALEQGENSDYTVVKLPKLNHLFQTCETGAPAEYALIEETMAPLALQTIDQWIGARVKKP